MKSRSDILLLVQAKIRLRHHAFSTEQAYCHWTARYDEFCLRLPKAWPAERKAEAFLTDLALKQGVVSRTKNQPIDALRQLMGHVSIETTAGYRHPLVTPASNPLDDLLGPT